MPKYIIIILFAILGVIISISPQQSRIGFMCTYLLEKYPTFFCGNLVDFNEAHLQKVTLKFHTHTYASAFHWNPPGFREKKGRNISNIPYILQVVVTDFLEYFHTSVLAFSKFPISSVLFLFHHLRGSFTRVYSPVDS